MTINWTYFLQGLAILLQVLNAVNVAGLPSGWQVAFTGILTLLQTVQAVFAHYYTPTGIAITAGTTVTQPGGLTQAAHPGT